MDHLLGGRLGRLAWGIYAAVYDVMWDNQLTGFLREEVACSIPTGADVVEVGAGTGLFSGSYLQRARSAQVSEPFAPMRKRFTRRHGFEPDVAALEDVVPSHAPRVVLACNVLHLVPDVHRAMRRLELLAGRSGRVVVLRPTRPSRIREVAALIREHGGGLSEVARFVLGTVVSGPLFAIVSRKRLPSFAFVASVPSRPLTGAWVLSEWEPGEGCLRPATLGNQSSMGNDNESLT